MDSNKAHTARTVAGWAKAVELTAKALAAVVGLTVLIFWQVRK